MDFLIVSNDPELYSGQRFMEEAQNLGLNAKHTRPYHSTIHSDGITRPKVIFHRTSGVMRDDFDLEFSRQLAKANNSLVVNDPDLLQKMRNKRRQYFCFDGQINQIPTFSFRGMPNENTYQQMVESFGELENKEQKYVMKPEFGNQGKGVTLINGKESFLSLAETLFHTGDQQFIWQPFIPEFVEFRLFYINNKLQIILQKNNGTDFRKNLHRTKAINIPLKTASKKLLEFSELLSEKIISFTMACDVAFFNEEFYLIEANFVPGLNQLEKISKQNVAKLLVETAIKIN